MTALHVKGGTLVLSPANCIEFASATDPYHAIEAEAFIHQVMPNIYLTDLEPQQIIDQKGQQTHNQSRLSLPPDLINLKFFADKSLRTPEGFNLNGIFTLTRVNPGQPAPIINELANSLREKIDLMRQDQQYLDKARTTLPNDRRPRTMIILGELMRGLMLDPEIRIKDNDMMDLIHASMPLNCCDYVLLDGAWQARVETMKERMLKADYAMPLAKSYSQRNNGIETFLSDLEAYGGTA